MGLNEKVYVQCGDFFCPGTITKTEDSRLYYGYTLDNGKDGYATNALLLYPLSEVLRENNKRIGTCIKLVNWNMLGNFRSYRLMLPHFQKDQDVYVDSEHLSG